MFNNDKILLLLFFCSGLFINLGTIYLLTVYSIYKYDYIENYIKKDKNFLENKMDNLLAFISGVIIQQIYIPFFILSIGFGIFLNKEIIGYDFETLREKIYVKYATSNFI